MAEISSREGHILELDALTITGESLQDRLKNAKIKDETIIRKVDNAYSKVGACGFIWKFSRTRLCCKNCRHYRREKIQGQSCLF